MNNDNGALKLEVEQIHLGEKASIDLRKSWCYDEEDDEQHGKASTSMTTATITGVNDYTLKTYREHFSFFFNLLFASKRKDMFANNYSRVRRCKRAKETKITFQYGSCIKVFNQISFSFSFSVLLTKPTCCFYTENTLRKVI